MPDSSKDYLLYRIKIVKISKMRPDGKTTLPLLIHLCLWAAQHRQYIYQLEVISNIVCMKPTRQQPTEMSSGFPPVICGPYPALAAALVNGVREFKFRDLWALTQSSSAIVCGMMIMMLLLFEAVVAPWGLLDLRILFRDRLLQLMRAHLGTDYRIVHLSQRLPGLLAVSRGLPARNKGLRRFWSCRGGVGCCKMRGFCCSFLPFLLQNKHPAVE
eukprot:284814923_6